jgi:hypothetical protein
VDRKALKVAGRSGAPSSAAKLNHSAIDLGGSVREERMPRIHRRRAGVRAGTVGDVRSDAETAGLRTRSLSAAFAAGCDAFDAKPIQFERLLATLRRSRPGRK